MTEPLRIAVADDEPDMRDYFMKILPRLGHRVVAAASTGSELVNLCRQHSPDLVITDIRMPDMEGIDAAIRIYEESAIPVILVSAYHDTELIKRAEADHIMGYLVKPIKRASLDEAVAFRRLQKTASDRNLKLAEVARMIVMAEEVFTEG
jgi:response regulator NasT